MRFFDNLTQAMSEVKRDMEEMGIKTKTGKPHLWAYSFSIVEITAQCAEANKEHWATIDSFIERKAKWIEEVAEKWDREGDLDAVDLNSEDVESPNLFVFSQNKIKILSQLRLADVDSLPLRILLMNQLGRAIAQRLNTIPSRPGIVMVDSITVQIMILK